MSMLFCQLPHLFFLYHLHLHSLSIVNLSFTQPPCSSPSIPEERDHLNRLFSTCSVAALISLLSPYDDLLSSHQIPPSRPPLIDSSGPSVGPLGPRRFTPKLISKEPHRATQAHVAQTHGELPGNTAGEQPPSH